MEVSSSCQPTWMPSIFLNCVGQMFVALLIYYWEHGSGLINNAEKRTVKQSLPATLCSLYNVMHFRRIFGVEIHNPQYLFFKRHATSFSEAYPSNWFTTDLLHLFIFFISVQNSRLTLACNELTSHTHHSCAWLSLSCFTVRRQTYLLHTAKLPGSRPVKMGTSGKYIGREIDDDWNSKKFPKILFNSVKRERLLQFLQTARGQGLDSI